MVTGISHILMSKSSQKPIPSLAIWGRIFHGTFRSGGGHTDYIRLVIEKMSCGRHSIVESIRLKRIEVALTSYGIVDGNELQIITRTILGSPLSSHPLFVATLSFPLVPSSPQ